MVNKIAMQCTKIKFTTAAYNTCEMTKKSLNRSNKSDLIIPGESKKKYTRLMSHKKVTIALILEI